MLNKGHEFSNTNVLKRNSIDSWIIDGPNKALLDEAEKFGKYISEELYKVKIGNKIKNESVTTSQIRQIFSKLKSIEAKGFKEEKQRTEFMMLKPYIAYAAGRHKVTGLECLKERVSWAIDAVLRDDSKSTEEQRFYNFCKLFEAILAYHRAYGGK